MRADYLRTRLVLPYSYLQDKILPEKNYAIHKRVVTMGEILKHIGMCLLMATLVKIVTDTRGLIT